MPVLPGWELYEMLRHEKPGLEARMVFVTAGATMSRAQSFLNRIPNQVLEKPFDTEELRAAIRTLCV